MKTKQTILVTGAAGFIGYHLCEALLKAGHNVVGLDNINDYYDINLKYARLHELGIARSNAEVFGTLTERIGNYWVALFYSLWSMGTPRYGHVFIYRCHYKQ